MKFLPTSLKDAWLVELEPRTDERGMFARTFCRREFKAHGLAFDYVQQNMSISAQRGTIRGMHMQHPPYSEAKLLRCVRGAILDVIIDLRLGSPTYMKHEGFELTSANRRQLYVPDGFAHGFQTLVDHTEVTYLVTSEYTPHAETGLRYSDPQISISWPLPVSVISDKDASWPLLPAAAAAYTRP